MAHLSDATVDEACETLKKAINAAQNSNQNGEDFVVAAVAGPAMLEALIAAESLFRNTFADGGTVHKQMVAAIARARGQS